MDKKRGIFGIVVVLFLIAGIFLVGSFQNEKNKVNEKVYEELKEDKEVPVIIKVNPEKKIFKRASIEDSKKEIIKDLKKEEVREYQDLISVKISKGELKELEKNPDVESISFSPQFKALLQDSVPLINSSNVWPIQSSGVNITGIDETVCVIDTGVNFTHPDLIGKNKTCVIDCYNKDCIENCSISDDNGHGTHVAGIVGASGGISGTAIDIGLIGLKILDSNGDSHPTSGTTDLMNAIDWCIANADTYNISVISMSLGTTTLYNDYCDSDFSTTLTKAINNATLYNISVIAATGNNGNKTAISSPACIQNSTAVGATDKSDNVASYSNRNNITDLFAPGSSINSTMYSTSAPICSDPGVTCSGDYATVSGTSMATPHVAGVFALFRQFFRLQNSRVPTPSEIENELNNTGVLIDDSSGSGYNFSRVDVWSALISIDISNPTVSLTSPSDATTRFIKNTSFSCSANDVLLSNITLYVWNSTGIYNNTEFIAVSSVNGNLEVNLTNMSYGDYEWNCLAYDHNNNFSFASSNYTLTIGGVAVTLVSPEDNLVTNQNKTYNCSVETEPIKLLTNVTFNIWNSTNSLIYNSTKNISGASNSTIFSYNFSLEGNYSWNCLGYNNESESAWADTNYTITYDITNPVLSSISSSVTTTTATITWTTNENANSSVDYGLSLSLGSSSSSSSLTTSHSISLSSLSSSTTYYYNVTSCDSAGNCQTNGSYSFTTSTPSTQSSSSSSGGGSSSTPTILSTGKTYSLTAEQISKGYTETLSKNDKIKFTFFDEKESEHTLTVNEIGENYVKLTIASSPINLILGIGQSAKLNLTSADYYNLYVKLESIIDNKAKLTIQTIHEPIPKSPSINSNVVEEKEEKPTPEKKSFDVKGKIKDILIIILIITVLFILFNKKEKKKFEKIKEYKERFRKYLKPKK